LKSIKYRQDAIKKRLERKERKRVEEIEEDAKNVEAQLQKLAVLRSKNNNNNNKDNNNNNISNKQKVKLQVKEAAEKLEREEKALIDKIQYMNRTKSYGMILEGGGNITGAPMGVKRKAAARKVVARNERENTRRTRKLKEKNEHKIKEDRSDDENDEPTSEENYSASEESDHEHDYDVNDVNDGNYEIDKRKMLLKKMEEEEAEMKVMMVALKKEEEERKKKAEEAIQRMKLEAEARKNVQKPPDGRYQGKQRVIPHSANIECDGIVVVISFFDGGEIGGRIRKKKWKYLEHFGQLECNNKRSQI